MGHGNEGSGRTKQKNLGTLAFCPFQIAGIFLVKITLADGLQG
jgi:hypothetical protein